MSDGGATVIVKGVEGAIELAKFKVGRVVLWVGATWGALTAATAKSGDGAAFFFLALCLALLALVAGYLAERKKRAERAALKSVLLFIGFAGLSLFGALWLVFRREKGPDAQPPTEAELDELVKE